MKETNTPTAGLESPPEAPISPREDNAQPIERLEKVVSPQNVTPTTTAAVTGSHTAGPILTQTSAAAPVTSVELTRAMQSPVNLEEQPKIPVVAAASDPASGVVAPQPVYPTTNIQAATTKTAQPTVARQLSGGQATDVPVQTDNAPVSNTTDVPDIQPSLEGNTQPVVVTSATGQSTTYVKHATQQNVVLPTQDPSHPSSVPISQPITAKQQLLAGQQAAANQQQGLQSQQGVAQQNKVKHVHSRQALADLDQKLSKLHNKKQPQQQKSAFSQPPVQNPAAPVQQFLQQTQPPLPGGMMGANVQQPMAGQAGQPVYGLPVAKQQMQLYYLQQQTGIPMGAFFQLPPGVDPMAFYGQQQMYPQHHQQQQQVKAFNQGYMLPQQQQGMQQAAGMMPQSGMQQQQQQQGVPQQASGMPQQASGMPQQMGMHQQQNQPQPVGLHQPAAVPLQQNAAPQVKQSDPQIPNQGVEIAETNTGETEVIEVKDSPSHQASKPSAGGQKEDTPPLKLYIPPAEGKQESQDSTGPSRFTVQKVQEDQSPKDLETAAAVVGSEVADKMSSSSLNVKTPEKEQKIGRFQVSKQVEPVRKMSDGEAGKPKHEAEVVKMEPGEVEEETAKVAKGRFQVSKVEEKPEEVKRKDSLPERPQPSAYADPELPREEIVDIGASSQQQQQSQGLFTDGKFSVQGSDRGTPDSLTSEGSSIPAPVGDLTVLQGNENVYMVPRPDSAQSVKSTTSQASLPGGGMHNPPVLERTNSSPNSNVSSKPL